MNEDPGRLILECAKSNSDPEPWERFLRYLKRMNYEGVLSESIKEAFKEVKGHNAFGIVVDSFKRLHSELERQRLLPCCRTDRLLHFKLKGKKEPLCKRERSATIHLETIPVSREIKICGPCMELLPESVRKTDAHRKIMRLWDKAGLEFDYPWDWERFM